MKPQNSKKILSKRSIFINLLSRSKGGRIDQFEQKLTWRSHTIGAAISRLRTSGKNSTTNKTQTGITVYRLLADAEVEV